MNKKNAIGIMFFVCIVITSLFFGIKDRQKLKYNGIIGDATILGDKFIKGANIKYLFINEEYLASTELGASKIKKLVGKRFPVIYIKEDKKNNSLLIFKHDFDNFNLPYPDSLKWVCDSLKVDKCR